MLLEPYINTRHALHYFGQLIPKHHPVAEVILDGYGFPGRDAPGVSMLESQRHGREKRGGSIRGEGQTFLNSLGFIPVRIEFRQGVIGQPAASLGDPLLDMPETPGEFLITSP